MSKYIVEVVWDGRAREIRCFTLSGARDQVTLELERYPHAQVRIFETVEVK